VDTPAPPSQGAGGLPLSLEESAPDFSYAFQPIVDTVAREVFSYEALIRGPVGESAWSVLGRVPSAQRYLFDRDTRVAAIALAAKLGVNCRLNLNFLPQGLYLCADSVSAALEASARSGLPVERLILEVTEGEVIDDQANFSARLNEFRSLGLSVAIDDFGAGYAGLGLLAAWQPDLIKIDIELVHDIHLIRAKQTIVAGVVSIARALDVQVLAEGVENEDELTVLRATGISLFQGYYFAEPALMALPEIGVLGYGADVRAAV
jgi:EAL domain-containing protein (putative c-di-GMP-specific phosphodiesterase class I)